LFPTYNNVYKTANDRRNESLHEFKDLEFTILTKREAIEYETDKADNERKEDGMES